MRILAIVALLTLGASQAMAQTKTCDALSQEKAKLAEALLAKIHPYDCCDDTIAGCLEAESPCSLVSRLANDVCRHVAAGREKDEIQQAMRRRAQSMMPTMNPASIDLNEATRAGDEDAKVTLVMYACTTCPFCYAIASDLHELITDGSLSGKVKLYYRSFPLRAHEGSVEGGLALTAAARLGKFWPVARLVYERVDDFSTEAVVDWAESVGLDRDEFEEKMKDSATRESLGESRREGMRNGVDSTPTFFINGRRYTYETTLEALEDVLLEEHERVTAAEGGSTD